MRSFRAAAAFSANLLRHERTRLLASVGGVTFALLLMLLQLGFRNALLDSSMELLRQMDADILVIHEEKRPFLKRDSIPRERLFQAQSVEGVERVAPMWLNRLYWKNPEDEIERSIRVIGFDPERPIFLNAEVSNHLEALEKRGNVLLDSRSRETLGDLEPGPGLVNRTIVEVVGTFPLGSDFEMDGNLVVSEETFFHLSPESKQRIEAVLIHLKDSAIETEVIDRLRSALPGDVEVYTKADLETRDLNYWKTGTPISIILMVGVSLGFAVGVVICYQILYTDVLDHLAEFATLKAMGYGDQFIQTVVLIEAWVLSFLGFIPSVILGWLMMVLLSWLSGLPAGLDISDVAQVGILSLVMCSLSGAFALRRVKQLDPAELF